MVEILIRISRLFKTGLILAISFNVQAAESVDANVAASIESKGTQIQKKWSNRVLVLADSIDGFFGNDRIEDDAQQTRVKLRLDFEKEESDSLDTKARLSARISLPRMENKLSIILNGDDDDQDDDDLEDDQDRSLALRFDAKSSLNRNLSFDIGFRRPNNSYELFGRARHRKTVALSSWVRRLDNKLYYYSDFGLEYDGTLEFDRVLPPSLLFRSKTRLRWWEDDSKCNDGFCPEQHFILYQRMKSPAHAISYELNTFFESEPSDGSGDYLNESRIRLRYRHRTRWDWAFVEFRPTVAFPRHNDYEPSWSVLIRLEAIFGYRPTYDTLEFGPESALQEISSHESN